MYNFSKKQKIIIGIILAGLAIIMLGYVYFRGNNETETDLVEENSVSNPESESSTDSAKNEEENTEEIIVHVAGAVNKEGIVKLKEGARINEAIEKAEGVTAEADMSQINLAYELEDGMKIYIPKKGESMEENDDQDYLVKFSTTTEPANANTGTSMQTTTSSTATANSKKTSNKVNINKADQAELETLPGVGESTAQKIIAYRTENGKFKTVEDIKEVSGIGDAKYDKIKDSITV